MVHFKVENQDATALAANYPHSPADLSQSTSDYFEDLLSQGWEIQTAYPRAGGQDWMFVFRANAQ